MKDKSKKWNFIPTFLPLCQNLLGNSRIPTSLEIRYTYTFAF